VGRSVSETSAVAGADDCSVGCQQSECNRSGWPKSIRFGHANGFAETMTT
jgi:hypothetical protein